MLQVTASKSGVHIYFSFKEHLGTAAVRGVSIFSGVEVVWFQCSLYLLGSCLCAQVLAGELSSGHVCSLPCPAVKSFDLQLILAC